MSEILGLRDVCYIYGDGHAALRNVTLSIESSSKVALVGPNGAGKSTLLLMLNGTLRPSSGVVLFRGQPMRYDSRSLTDIRKSVGMVFQNSDDQLFAPTVEQDIAFGPLNLGYPGDKIERYVGYALSYVGLEEHRNRPPHHLSGGEKKRVAIAGILVMEPDVLVLDEPTSNLDPATSEEIMEMLDELNLYGKTVVISTHDVELAYRWADEVVLMDGGEVVRTGPPEKVFADPDTLRKARLKLPAVLEIYREMLGRGLLAPVDELPRNIVDLMHLIESAAGISGRKPGRIYICDISGTPPSRIRDILSSGAVSYIGAMGTKAKMVANEELLELDFSYGVVDKCVLKAIAGRSSLIITSGGMVEHAERRIRSYAEEFGIEIEVIILPRAHTSTPVDNINLY
ncbi:MAG TPA: ATP-binding cassette domain-containing protein [Methanothrix sp.]|nr:ATP-binding cassette domain-containing protein [Methanothrix sp.]HOK58684.1 ATP-binding cassette domain-containing protein [Methanothrix sp.]HOL43856.1 ATP-binding cassette domain-containing protein [Methanothrix sp.]HPO88976.1 ATP-binding cassette domain-containing protein [Methanothrix sp.]